MSVFGKPRAEGSRRRPRTGRCKHRSPVLAEQVEGGVVCRCLVCTSVGPVRKTSEEARRALQGIGA
jgi:hypothetical protein